MYEMPKYVLMCPPENFFNGEPHYQINDWMKEKKPINYKMARKQWEALFELYVVQLGIKVNLIKPRQSLPDMCFTANCGIIAGNVFLSSRFKNDERRLESLFFEEYFSKPRKMNNYIAAPDEIYFEWETKRLKVKTITPDDKTFFEGQGDAVLIDKKNLVIGYGTQRTSPAGAEWVKSEAEKSGVNVIPVEINVLPGKKSLYHLDTCLCWLPKSRTFLVYLESFGKNDLAKLEKIGEIVSVSYEEAERLACNMLIHGNFAVSGFINDRLAEILEKRGYLPVRRDVSEFEKAGGGVKCLTFEY